MLFITTHNLATNPRLFKEAQLAMDLGYKVEIICFEFENWSKKLNEQLKLQLKSARITSIPAGRRPFFPWITSVLSEQFHRKVAKYFSLPTSALNKAVSRRTNMLLRAVEKIKIADIVIGHNPGALWPTLYAAKKFNCPAGFDVEDYHPGEGDNLDLQALSLQLLQQSLSEYDYISFASPLIFDKFKTKEFHDIRHPFTVLNFFSASEFIKPKFISSLHLRMIWFSQNIGFDRGLEKVLPVVDGLSPEVELHLYGNMDLQFFEQHLRGKKGIVTHPAVPQSELHRLLSEFDVGLAIEPGKDENNMLAISNKMLAYFQAGLYILYTETRAQADFLQEFPEHGKRIDSNFENAAEAIRHTISNLKMIRETKLSRYLAAGSFNWENESKKISQTWAALLN